jgi:peptidoglycan hydrolase-like protein with peptidoglycan-binding domain
MNQGSTEFTGGLYREVDLNHRKGKQDEEINPNSFSVPARSLAIGIGGAALDATLNNGADADNTANVLNMPATSGVSENLGTGDSFRKDDIRWAQVELRYAGLYKGSLDGILGPQTKWALTQFQQNNGLAQTASLDAQTWEALTSSPGIAQGSSSMPSDVDRSGSMTNSSPASDLGR